MMKRTYKILMLAFCCSVAITGISKDPPTLIIGPANLDYYSSPTGLNYIVSCTPLKAVQQIRELSKEEQQRASVVQYYDDLGRPIQTMLPLQSPAGNDLVSSITYDALGRESRRYLTVPVGGSNGGNYVAMTTLVLACQNTYGADASRAFTETVYEASPLNRVTKQLMPGAAWEVHPVQIDYQINSSPLVTWHATSNGNYTSQTYAPHQLYITQATDPDGRLVREYKDKHGKLVMTEAYDGTDWLQTRFVYDDFGLQKAIVPPQAASINNVEYCYYYEHDARYRIIKKKIPGADWVYMVYDKADRLILTQDGRQHQRNEWTFRKYDVFGREIITGLYSTMLTHSALQTQFANVVVTEEYTGSGLAGYSWTKEPIVNQAKDLLSVNYYDNYLAIIINSALTFTPNNLSGSAYAQNNKGRVTATITAILPPDLTPNPFPNGEGSLTTVFYYDDYNRVIQTVSTNHVGGTDRVSTKYDFRGNVLETLQASSWVNDVDDPGSLTLRQTIEYDLVKRPITMNIQLNKNPIQPFAQMDYDELGRVKEKRLHQEGAPSFIADTGIINPKGGPFVLSTAWADTTMYTYNIQNWLKKISGDLFTQELFYEQVPSGSGVIPQFGGNISGMDWKTPSKDKATYAFTYDGVSRLTNSQFSNAYTEHLTYDKNDNITTLKRYGATTFTDNLTYTYNGNQVTQIANNISGSIKVAPTMYSYDFNGNTIREGSTSMTYNLLNLPQQVQLVGGRKIENTYAADGRKLATVAQDGLELKDGTKKYNGNLVFDMNGDLEYILFSEGRILHNPATSSYTFEYSIKNHIGSPCVVFVPTATGAEVIQENAFYPYGMRIEALSWHNPLYKQNRYLREGMEFVSDHGWNRYDHHARTYNPATGLFDQIDPLAAKFPWMSPRAFCNNNPFNNIDPDGRIVIFINGLTFSNSKKGQPAYWRGTYGGREIEADNLIMDQLGDYKPLYRHGGNSLNPLSRYTCGYRQGMIDAEYVLSQIVGEGGIITGTIKIITHSMGAAFGKGYVKALLKYIEEKGHKNAIISLVADFDPYQALSLTAESNIHTQQFTHKKRGEGSNAWLANQRQHNLPNANYHDDPDKGDHSILSFVRDFSNLQEGIYVWNGWKWILSTEQGQPPPYGP